MPGFYAIIVIGMLTCLCFCFPGSDSYHPGHWSNHEPGPSGGGYCSTDLAGRHHYDTAEKGKTLTQICVVDFSILINWKNQFSNLGCLVYFFISILFHIEISVSKLYILIRRSILRHLICVCIVYLDSGTDKECSW